MLPRSGAQAGIGQDCQRAVDIAPGHLQGLGLPDLVDHQRRHRDQRRNRARARREADQEGAQLLVGAFNSGQTSAIAQVAEQKGIPFVINIAAAPPITEQGYKFVFRNFPTAPMILGDAFANQKEVFEAAGTAPKTVVFLHVNDTFGTAMARASAACCRSSACLTPSRRPSPTIPPPAIFRSRSPGRKAPESRRAAGGQPPQRCHPADPRNGQAALDADGRAEHGPGLVRGSVSARRSARSPMAR